MDFENNSISLQNEPIRLSFLERILLIFIRPSELFEKIEEISISQGFFTFLILLIIPLIYSFFALFSLGHSTQNLGIFKIFFDIGSLFYTMIYIIPLILSIPLLFLGSYILKKVCKLFGNEIEYKNSFNILVFSSMPILIFYILSLIPFLYKFLGYFSCIFFIWFIILLGYGIKLHLKETLGMTIAELVIFLLVFGVISLILMGIILLISFFLGASSILYNTPKLNDSSKINPNLISGTENIPQEKNISNNQNINNSNNYVKEASINDNKENISNKFNFSSCINDLSDWTSAYELKNDANIQGTYRLIYTNFRLSIDNSGKVCQCYLTDSTNIPERKRTGYLINYNTINWDYIWDNDNNYFTDSYSPLNFSSIVTMYKGDEKIGIILIDFLSENSCNSIQINKDSEMNSDEICNCLGK